MLEGNPDAYLPVFNYLLMDASKRVARFVNSKGYDLASKNDYMFMKTVYEILVIFI
jgi:hypothetical protein